MRVFLQIFLPQLRREAPDLVGLRWDWRQCSVDPGFNVSAVLSVAKEHASYSWEYGVLAEAMLELHNRELSVFNEDAFPEGKLPTLAVSNISNVTSLAFAQPFIDLNHERGILIDDASNSDPASLGVSALLLGQALPVFAEAASKQAHTLLHSTPRFANGAIPHRFVSAEVWGDAVYMVPPFLADNDNLYLREAVHQISLHRDVLRAGSAAKVTSCEGAWKHFAVGPDGGEFSPHGNPALWSTSNGWAAAGMVRVLATIYQKHGRGVNDAWNDADTMLVNSIMEIMDCAIAAPSDELANGRGALLRNHLDDIEWFGEAAGTALFSSVAYRLATLIPEVNWDKYTQWADLSREAVVSCIDKETGIIRPVVKWGDWHDTQPWDQPSSEAQSFAILMHAAHRDCVCALRCPAPVEKELLVPS